MKHGVYAWILVSALILLPSRLFADAGDHVWTGQTGGNHATWSTPLLSGDLVIIKEQDGGISALNAATGTPPGPPVVRVEGQNLLLLLNQ